MIYVSPEYPNNNCASFRIGENNAITVANALTHLELLDIFVLTYENNKGYASVLMTCALMMGLNWELDTLKGIYHPLGNTKRAEKWYKEIGATFKRDSVVWVEGNIREMHKRCTVINSKFGNEFELLNSVRS